MNRDILLEIANRSSDPLFVAGLGRLPNPDEVLRKAGLDQEVYSQIMTDSHVWSKIMDRRSAVSQVTWQIAPVKGGERALALCQQAVASMSGNEDYPLANSIVQIQDAVFRGWRALEVVWQNTADGWLPIYLRDIPNRRMIHDGNSWRLLTTENATDGVEFPPYKILMARHASSYDNPYGEAILSRCYWPYIFKHNGLKWWVTLAERYGLPWVIGRLGGEANEAARQELAAKLASLALDAVAVVPQGAEVQIETMQGVSPDVHDRLVRYCNAEISKVIVGQTLTTELDGEGSRAAAQVHSEIRDEIVAGDKRLIGSAMHRLFRWICEVNGVDPALAPKWEELKPEDTPKSNKPVTQRNSQSFASQSQIENQKSKIEYTPEQQAIEDLHQTALQASENAMNRLLTPVVDMIQDAKSIEEIRDSLFAKYPGMDANELSDILSRAMFLSEIWGREHE